MAVRLYDAHNHLQDERLTPQRASILTALQTEGVAAMVVNGSSEQDWPSVLALASEQPMVIPSFGHHPWYVNARSPQWKEALLRHIEAVPAGVGEIGLDCWIRDHDLGLQQEMFVWQLRLAAERNLPVSIHCLRAWDPLLNLLRTEPRPSCGFVLHSFGGPQELIGELAQLGAYFSLPGYFAIERKERQREAFRHVPPDRFLIETDAPDQLLPESRRRYALADPGSGKAINHPANLAAVYAFAAELYGEPIELLASRVEANFHRLFGGLVTSLRRFP